MVGCRKCTGIGGWLQEIEKNRGLAMGNPSIKTQVYEHVLRDILDGIYLPNAVINEKNLMEKFNVSKTPVREALVQLCSEGYMKNIPRFGYQVTMITPSEILEMIEFRKVIELGALERTIDLLTIENLAELKEMNRQVEEIDHRHEVKLHWALNQDFHKKLCSYSGNRYLQKALDDSLNVCSRISNQYYVKVWENEQEGAYNHKKVVQALEEKNLERAKVILAEDIEELLKNRIW